jgi:hypothetical protein
VAPPLTPAEQTGWLKLAAQVLQKAGWPLEAGRVLLVMGPEHVPAARRVMSTVPKAEAARLYENMVRAELLGSAAADNTTASGSGSSSTNSGEIRPLQLQGSFMAAAAALKEAFCLYRDGGEPGECWRLLQEYQPLQDVLPPDDQDRALLVGDRLMSCSPCYALVLHCTNKKELECCQCCTPVAPAGVRLVQLLSSPGC